MRARVADRGRALEIVDLLRAAGHEVLAPFRGHGRDTLFESVTDENRDRVQLHVPNPYYPPKRVVFPHIERLMRIRQADGVLAFEPTFEAPRVAVFGIRSCDVAAIYHLDRFFLGGAYRDPYYAERRRRLFLVNVVCTDPDVDLGPECFCVCTDTGPAARDHFDLQLMELGDEVMVVAGSPEGEALLSAPMFRPCTAAHVARRRALLADLRTRFHTTTSWFSAAVRHVSSGDVAEQTWEELGRRCLECGGCTFVCPACTCFTVTDRRAGPDEVERVRVWDSCALGGFTRMAGGHNPRKAVHDRRNRRFFRKLSHYFIQRELSMACVGCGRCAEVCHGGIGMPSVVELIRRGATEGGRNAPVTA